MKTNETQADIIREMRDLGALDEQCGDMIPRSLQALGLRTYAARLDAARKREQGDAAAMRAALLNAKTRFASIALMNSEWRTCAESHVREIAAALSAPARNCDRFATVDEAKAEWLRTNAKLLSSTGLMPFESWLFAKAKGGAK